MAALMRKLWPVKQPGTPAEDRIYWIVDDSHWRFGIGPVYMEGALANWATRLTELPRLPG